MERGLLDTIREIVLAMSVFAMVVWCVRSPSLGVPVLVALVSVPVLAVFVKAGVESALILLDQGLSRRRER
jgi:hypothetical protein